MNCKVNEMNWKVKFQLLIIIIHIFIGFLLFSANAWDNLQFMIKNKQNELVFFKMKREI